MVLGSTKLFQLFVAVILASDILGNVMWSTIFRDKSIEPSQLCKCTCGLPNRRSRLIGGTNAEFNEYPWTVYLHYKGKFYCGGTLISSRYILTAGHCVHGVNYNSLSVMVGDHLRDFPLETNSKEYKAVYIIVHPEFNATSYDNDLALVKLSQPVPYKWYSRPACLPQPNRDYVGDIGIVTGWGRIDENGDTAPYLQEMDIPIMSNIVCKNLGYKPFEITDNMICAGFVEGGKDSCSGDSGGGLMRERDDKKIDIIGIVSWGNGCGRHGYPGVNTRVSRYLPWIMKHTRDSCYCGRRRAKLGLEWT